MKEKQLMKGAAFMLLAATAIPPAHAQLKTNAGVQYLLSQSKRHEPGFSGPQQQPISLPTAWYRSTPPPARGLSSGNASN